MLNKKFIIIDKIKMQNSTHSGKSNIRIIMLVIKILTGLLLVSAFVDRILIHIGNELLIIEDKSDE